MPEEYSLYQSVSAWIYSDIQPVPEITSPSQLSRVVSISSVEMPVIIRQEQPGAPLSVYSPQAGESLRDVVTRMLGLDIDTTGALRVLEEDPVLSSLHMQVRGIRPYSTPSVFEALIKTVIQQQISYRAANVLTKRLIERMVIPVRYSEMDVYGFPNPDKFIALGIEGLRSIGLGYKASILLSLCNEVVSGRLELENMHRMTYEELSSLLLSLRGVGEWTLQTVCIAGLRRFDVFPNSDIGIRNLLGRLYFGGVRATNQQVLDLMESWGRHAAMALYLLMCADVLGLVGPHSRTRSR
ncbi:MAG: DNA-3-methyladenine glycosylase 2 family protein [Candidatus Thorarchaeota archaeon]|nr:DNA-3-methyladenine glycosylase 2 family protein [Candidatus Thorarchaeota archaeon]